MARTEGGPTARSERRPGPRWWPRLVALLLVLSLLASLAVPLLWEQHRQDAPRALAACLQEFFDRHGRYPETWQEAARGSFLTRYLEELIQDPDPRRDLHYTVWADRRSCEFVLIDRTLRLWQAHRTRHAYWQSRTPETVYEQHWDS